MGKSKNKKQMTHDITETNQKVSDVMDEASNMDSHFDPNGSYTGNPTDQSGVPVQDADDL